MVHKGGHHEECIVCTAKGAEAIDKVKFIALAIVEYAWHQSVW